MELLEFGPGLSERVALARELGHVEVLVLLKRPQVSAHAEITALGAVPALLVSSTSQARQQGGTYRIVAPSRRDFFESLAVDHILNPEHGGRPDFIHHRNSGLNQVLLRYCKEKSILTTLATLHRAQGLGRMQQNARWCAKLAIPYHLVSGAQTRWEQRSAHDLLALRRVLLSKH